MKNGSKSPIFSIPRHILDPCYVARMGAPSDYVGLPRCRPLFGAFRLFLAPAPLGSSLVSAVAWDSARSPGRHHATQIGNYLGDAPMHYLWAPIRPFIGGGHTVGPVLPRFSIFKNTNLRPRFRGFPENLGLAFEGSFS